MEIVDEISIERFKSSGGLLLEDKSYHSHSNDNLFTKQPPLKQSWHPTPRACERIYAAAVIANMIPASLSSVMPHLVALRLCHMASFLRLRARIASMAIPKDSMPIYSSSHKLGWEGQRMLLRPSLAITSPEAIVLPKEATAVTKEDIAALSGHVLLRPLQYV